MHTKGERGEDEAESRGRQDLRAVQSLKDQHTSRNGRKEKVRRTCMHICSSFKSLPSPSVEDNKEMKGPKRFLWAGGGSRIYELSGILEAVT